MAAAKRRDLPSPLFLTEEATAALAGKTLAEWAPLALVLERHGLPCRDPLLGGRHRGAVEAFFDRRAGLRSVAPAPMDGAENPNAL